MFWTSGKRRVKDRRWPPAQTLWHFGAEKRIRSHWKSACVVWLALMLPGLAQAEITLEQAGQLLQRVDKVMRSGGTEWFARITYARPRGRVKSMVAYGLWEDGPRRAGVMVAPEKLKGGAMLREGNTVWTHLPGEAENRRTTLGKSFTGGLFTNADLLALDFSQEFDVVRVKEENADIAVLDLKPKTRDHPYRKLRMRVDVRREVPLDVAQFLAGKVLLKKVFYEDLKRFGDAKPRPATLRVESPLNPAYSATLRYGDIRIRELRDWMFSQSFLPRFGLLLK